MAIYDSICERYGITLKELLDNYSMSQIALLSHVSYLKFEDEQERTKQESRYGKKKFLNPNDPNNTQAYLLIASGALG